MISSDVMGVDSSSVSPPIGSDLVGKMQHNEYHATQVTMQMLNTIFWLVGVVLNVAKIIKVRRGLKLYTEKVSEESFLPISAVERRGQTAALLLFLVIKSMCKNSEFGRREANHELRWISCDFLQETFTVKANYPGNSWCKCRDWLHGPKKHLQSH